MQVQVDLNLLANMVAKLGKIVGEHVTFGEFILSLCINFSLIKDVCLD